MRTITERRKAIQKLQAELARVPHEHLAMIIAMFVAGAPYQQHDVADELRRILQEMKRDVRGWLTRELERTQPSESDTWAMDALSRAADKLAFRPEGER